MAHEALGQESNGMRLGRKIGKTTDAFPEGALAGQERSYSYLDIATKMGEPDAQAAEEELEKGEKYRIIRKRGEKIPAYIVSLPRLTKGEKEILKNVERKAIAEITIEAEIVTDPSKKRRVMGEIRFIGEISSIIQRDYPWMDSDTRHTFAELIMHNMIGYGPLENFLSDDALEEIMVLGTGKRVYVFHRKYGMCKTNIIFETDAEIVNIADKMARTVGRRMDLSSPLLDARLPDGSRVNATLNPVSLDGPSITVRKFKAVPLTIVDLVNFRTLDSKFASFLWLAVEGAGVKPVNFLVSGGTGSGKTTTLNCMGSFIPSNERVITIEDTAELQLPVEHWVRLETRPPNIEGKGEIMMGVLLKNVLRMRPDRIIVGEVRGEEANILLASMNTGQNGCMGTVHANTAQETITRLISAPMSVPTVMIPSLDLILMQNKFFYKGKMVRRITEIGEITGIKEGKVTMEVIYKWDPRDDKVKPTGKPITIIQKFAKLRGVSESKIIEEMGQREKVIDYMVKNSIRSLSEVGAVMTKYHTSPESLLAEIGLGKKAGVDKEKASEKIIEQDSLRKIARTGDERTPRYVVALPELSSKEKEMLHAVEERAIGEIQVDPMTIRDVHKVKKLFLEKITSIMSGGFYKIDQPKREHFARLIIQNMLGYGMLEFFLSDDDLEEIMVVGPGRPIYVQHRKYGACRTNVSFDSDADLMRIVERIATSVGRRVDRAAPLLDARLPDGSRVNITIAPVSLNGSTITIRKFRKEPITIIDLINLNTLDADISAYLWLVVEGLAVKPGNIIVAGGSSSGKTTTLNCIGAFIPPTNRVITIEDTAELRFSHEHCIRLETKPPNVEGRGEVSMDSLVKNTLRMRPDRILVGEIRGIEARTLFTAMNTGHDGCMGTTHANSATETIVRLTNPPMSVPRVMLPALNLILVQSKVYHGGKTLRRITEAAELVGREDKVDLNFIYKRNPRSDALERTDAESVVEKNIASFTGMTMEELKSELEKRKAVLEWMVENQISKFEDVSRIINEYYTDAAGLMSKIKKR